MATLTKTTDTPKARKATTARKAPSTKVTSSLATPPVSHVTSEANAVAFVALCVTDDSTRVAKAIHIGLELASGATNGGLANTYGKALLSAGRVIPASFQAAISQSGVAYARAKRVTVIESGANETFTNALVLGCLRLVNVAKARVETFLAEKFETMAEFETAVTALIKSDKAAKAAAKGEAATTTDDDGEPVTVEPEESLSVLADVKRSIATLKSCLALLQKNLDPTEHDAALELLMQFADDYALIPEMA